MTFIYTWSKAYKAYIYVKENAVCNNFFGPSYLQEMLSGINFGGFRNSDAQ